MNQDNLFKALKEVDVILQNTRPELISRIPNKFMHFMKEMKDDGHNFQIDKTKSLAQQNMLYETTLILSIILKTSWYDDDMIEKIKKKFNKTDSDFNKDREKQLNQINDEIKSLTVIKKENFIKKIFNKIKTFFKKRI